MERSRVCRICMTESGILLSLFGDDAFWRKIVSFANVEIYEKDPLPQQICTTCAREVLSASSLKQKCEDADKYFRRIAEIKGLCTMSRVSTMETEEIIIKTESTEVFDEEILVAEVTTTSQNQPLTNRISSHKTSIQSPNCPGFTSSESSSPVRLVTSPISNQSKNEMTSPYNSMTIIPNGIQIHGWLEAEQDDLLELRSEGRLGLSTETRSESLQEAISESRPEARSKRRLEARRNPSLETRSERSIESRSESRREPSREAASESRLVARQEVRSGVIIEHCSILQPEKLAPIKLRYSSSTSSAQILSNTNNDPDNFTIIENEPNLVRKRGPKGRKSFKSALNQSSIIKTEKHNKKIKLSPNSPGKKLTKKLTPNSGSINSSNKIRLTNNDTDKHGVQCEICGDKFALKNILKIHMRTIHADVQTFVYCDKCKRTYKSNFYYERHIKNRQCRISNDLQENTKSPSLNKFTCQYCGRTFPTGRHYGWHKRPGRCFGNKNKKPQKVSLVPDETLFSTSKEGESTSKIKDINTTQCNGNVSQVSHSTPFIMNPTGSVKTTFRWNVSEFNEGASIGSFLSNSSKENSKSSIVINNTKPNEINTRDENFDTSNTNQSAIVINRKHSKRGRPQKLAKKLNNSLKLRKSRKSYVYMDEAKWQQGKEIIANGGSVLLMSQQLNISRNSAWRVRQRILANKSMKFRKRRDIDSKENSLPGSRPGIGLSPQSSTPLIINSTKEDLEETINIAESSETTDSSGVYTGEMKELENNDSLHTDSLESSQASNDIAVSSSRIGRRRSEAGAKRQVIANEIMKILEEDKNAQYWKIANRLADKGFHITPPAICRILQKSGYSRRKRLVYCPKKDGTGRDG